MSLYLSLLIFSIQDVGHYHSNQPLFSSLSVEFVFCFECDCIGYVWIYFTNWFQGELGWATPFFFSNTTYRNHGSWFSQILFFQGVPKPKILFLITLWLNLPEIRSVYYWLVVLVVWLFVFYVCVFFFFLKNFLLADNNKFSKNINPKIWRPNFFLS